MMTNAVTAPRNASKHCLAAAADQRPSTTTTAMPPPTPPPPPIRARGELPLTVRGRRLPAPPPAAAPACDEEDFVDLFELDPVTQNEQNDEIWQRRIVADGQRVPAGGASVAPSRRPDREPTPVSARDRHRVHRGPSSSRHRRSSSQPPAAASHSDGCRHCRRAETGLRPSPVICLMPTTSRADNDYVDDPSSSVVPADTAVTTPAGTPRRLSDLLPTATDTARREPAGLSAPLKSTKEEAGSSTSLRAAVTYDRGGVTCKVCGGCRCGSCRRADVRAHLCTCRAYPTAPSLRHQDDQLCCRCSRRCVVRTVLGACVPCLCPCWLWTVSTCKRHCTNRPEPCRCHIVAAAVDSL